MNLRTGGGVSLIVVASACARYEHRAPIGQPVTDSAAAASAAPGMLVYRDPVTGQFVDPPAARAAQPQAASAPTAPALAEVPSPGGGTMVRLNNQFQNFVTVEVGPDGGVTTHCDGRPQ